MFSSAQLSLTVQSEEQHAQVPPFLRSPTSQKEARLKLSRRKTSLALLGDVCVIFVLPRGTKLTQ